MVGALSGNRNLRPLLVRHGCGPSAQSFGGASCQNRTDVLLIFNQALGPSQLMMRMVEVQRVEL